MGSAVGKKPTRLAKSEPYIKCASCDLMSKLVQAVSSGVLSHCSGNL